MTKTRLTACAVTLAAACAAAAPTAATAAADEPLDRVLVRTEGKTATLAEGALLTRGHVIQASGDATPRTCDATNNGGAAPRPTPTTSTVDAMTLAGRSFDGDWYPGYDDYFINRFGPDRQDLNIGAYYGIYVNGILTSVGGCQRGMNRDDVALWIWDAFRGRTRLRLDGPEGVGEATADVEQGPSVEPVRNAFTVDLGQPLAVHVKSSSGGEPGYPTPAAGVDVSPVKTDPATGDQTVLHGDPATVVTDANGDARVSWSTPGWKRIKADKLAATPDERDAIRSNRLDVCVRNARGEDCGPPPADARVRGVDAPRFDSDAALGTVDPGATGSPATITFENPDTLPATITELRTSGDMAGDFAVISQNCTGAAVQPGGSCQARVRFVPSTSGLRAAALDAVLGSGVTVTARLAGRGTATQEAGSTAGSGSGTGAPGAPGPRGPAGASTPRASLRLASGPTWKVDRRGRFGVKVRCRASVTCRGTVTLRTTQGRYLGRATYVVARGQVRMVRVSLTRSARRLLDERRKLRVVARSGRVAARMTIHR